jgi:ankyrin repeat protein
MASAGKRKRWTIHHHESKGKTFYHDRLTGKSSWKKPDGLHDEMMPEGGGQLSSLAFAKALQDDDLPAVNVVNHKDGSKEGRLRDDNWMQLFGANDVDAMVKWMANPRTHMEDTEPTKAQTALIWCSRRGADRCVKLLLRNGADANARMSAGATALYVATQEQHEKCLEHLLDGGCDPDASLGDGVAPIHTAALHHNAGCMKLLIQAGANLNKAKEDGTTALHIAVVEGIVDCVGMLLEAKCDVHARMSGGASALYLAAQEGFFSLLKILIAHGANVNEALESGTTIVYIAAALGHAECLGYLVDQGASVETPDLDGDSPLSIASDNGHDDCVEILTKAGAKAVTTKKNSKKPIRRASFMKSKKVKLSVKEEATKEDIIHDGYLHKKATGVSSRWQKRYFVLQGHFLQYFESSSKRNNLKGSLDMKDLTSIELVQDKSTQQTILLRLTVEDAQLLLRAGTEAAALKWEMHLQKFLPFSNVDAQLDGAKLIQSLWKSKKSPKASDEKDSDSEEEEEEEKEAGKSSKAVKRRHSFIKPSEVKGSALDGDLLMQGYMQKLSSGMRKKWQERFFVVTGHYLRYYESENRKKLKGVLDLNDVQSVELLMQGEGPDAIGVILLQVEDTDVSFRVHHKEANNWTECIKTFAAPPPEAYDDVVDEEVEDEDDIIETQTLNYTEEEVDFSLRSRLYAFYLAYQREWMLTPNAQKNLLDISYAYNGAEDELNQILRDKYDVDMEHADFPEHFEKFDRAAHVITRFVRVKNGGPAFLMRNAMAQFTTNQAKPDYRNLKEEKFKQRRVQRTKSFVKNRKYLKEALEGNAEAEVIMSGSLLKRTKGRRKRWANRYFVVAGHYLKYFSNDKQKVTKGVSDLYDMLTCELLTESCEPLDPDEDENKEDGVNERLVVLRVCFGSGEDVTSELLLRAGDADGAHDWKAALEEVLKGKPEEEDDDDDDNAAKKQEQQQQQQQQEEEEEEVEGETKSKAKSPEKEAKKTAEEEEEGDVEGTKKDDEEGKGEGEEKEEDKKEDKKKKKHKGRRMSFNKSKNTFRASVYEGETKAEGYLAKQTTGFRKRWQNRFFVLSGHYLKYYEDQKQATTKGVIDINELEVCQMEADGTTLLLKFSADGFDVKVCSLLCVFSSLLSEPALLDILFLGFVCFR